MITIEDIKNWSKPHPLTMVERYNNAKSCRIGNERIEISIVGGCSGLYGDFETTFEVAVIDKTKNKFVTRYFHETPEDVIGWMESEKMVELVNSLFKKDEVILY